MRTFVKYLFAAMLLGSATTALFLWIGGDVDHFTPETNRMIWIGSTIVFVISLAGVVWAVTRRDKVPDFLAAITGNYYQHDGFCFVVLPTVANGLLTLTMLAQNKFSERCEATLAFKPWADRERFLPEQVELSLPPAALVAMRIPVAVPDHLQGKSVEVEIFATARYPDGRGQLLRFREGLTVGRPPNAVKDTVITALFAAIGFLYVSSPATLDIKLSTELANCLMDDISTTTTVLWKLGDAETIDIQLPPLS